LSSASEAVDDVDDGDEVDGEDVDGGDCGVDVEGTVASGSSEGGRHVAPSEWAQKAAETGDSSTTIEYIRSI
jgi:hypothetical protein